ncbi:MAG: sigma-70 family RNA polymerase sigma factor [Gammaproteobacteria bacterium]|nr:sigma-70 family RNA polymerase sigma factor [Gammaproteobacteria bacterium]
MNSLFKQAYQYTGNTQDAEDLLQDLLVELYQKQDKLHTAKSLRAWLMRCLYNRFVDGYRKKKSAPNFDSLHDEYLANKLPNDDSPETSYWHKQVLAGLSLLSREQRMVVCLHDIEGHTLAELSDIMKIPLGTLKSHLFRGRRILQDRFKLQPFDDCVRL